MSRETTGMETMLRNLREYEQNQVADLKAMAAEIDPDSPTAAEEKARLRGWASGYMVALYDMQCAVYQDCEARTELKRLYDDMMNQTLIFWG